MATDERRDGDSIHLLVVPAETHPCQESFLDEVVATGGAGIRRSFLMRTKKRSALRRTTWRDAAVELMEHRPTSRLLAWCAIYFGDLRFVPRLVAFGRGDRPDVILVRDLSFPLLVALALRPWFHWGVIYQKTFPHELQWADPKQRNFYRLPALWAWARRVEFRLLHWACARCEAVLPISASMGDELVGWGACKQERCHPFGMGVTEQVFAAGPPERRAPDAPLRLVYVGTLSRPRRLETLVDAVSLVRERDGLDVRLTLYGGTPSEIDTLQAHVRRTGASYFVDVAGRVSREELYVRMAEHDAGAIFIAHDPRFRVASTTKLLESLVIGLPCVATDAVLMHREMESLTGAVVIVGDESRPFADGIVKLHSRWSEISERALQSRERVLAAHSYAVASARFQDIIWNASLSSPRRAQ